MSHGTSRHSAIESYARVPLAFHRRKPAGPTRRSRVGLWLDDVRNVDAEQHALATRAGHPTSYTTSGAYSLYHVGWGALPPHPRAYECH
ncbi:hypothetical protein EXIGLDRAFT_730739 [Exidia glandulosa HHB12029]|uniref:Uncharacterized protein n=1 Tax=Exidia glandulosa HHB12029 TaxID=1314781 RepID=A0A165C358_EXIGL|nr:hypothetical protein EXIGLDRAFT_730739 [Exidia glandulosa HHB12029]